MRPETQCICKRNVATGQLLVALYAKNISEEYDGFGFVRGLHGGPQG